MHLCFLAISPAVLHNLGLPSHPASHSNCKTLLDEEESGFLPPLPGPTGKEVWPRAPIHDLMMRSVTW